MTPAATVYGRPPLDGLVEASPDRLWPLAAAIAGRARVRVSRDGGRSYPAGCERPLTATVPAAPAAVLLFDNAAEARCLAADFDVSRGGQERVDADAAGFAALIEACGGRTFADVSPTGGRHVYVLWSRPRPITELRPLMRALCVLFPSLDPAPMLNPAAGCIRPPGAAHRAGGHQRLSTPLPQVESILADPNGPGVWAALLDRLSPALGSDDHGPLPDLEPGPAVAAGGRLSERVERIARTGEWDTTRYASASEARQAVVTAAAAAGWRLPDLAARIEQGVWPGLAGLYARYSRRNRRAALGRDLRKAQGFLGRGKTARNSPTREWTHTGGTRTGHDLQSQKPVVGDEAEYRWIRAWWNACLATERIRWTDRSGQSKRLVLRALGAMAQRRGTRVLDVGRRGLALACGLDDSTVGAVLRALREEDDPIIELLEAGTGERADTYTLRIPDAGLHAAAWRRWRAGRIDAIHPVFRELGAARALVFEALGDRRPAQRRDITHDAALPPGTVDEALRVLAEHGLAERVPNEGWRRGPLHPDRVARALGIDELVERLVQRYRTERAAWRALLDGIATRRAAGPMPGEQVPWPAVLTAPPPTGPADQHYDDALAELDDPMQDAAVNAAIELLIGQFGATVAASPD